MTPIPHQQIEASRPSTFAHQLPPTSPPSLQQDTVTIKTLPGLHELEPTPRSFPQQADPPLVQQQQSPRDRIMTQTPLYPHYSSPPSILLAFRPSLLSLQTRLHSLDPVSPASQDKWAQAQIARSGICPKSMTGNRAMTFPGLFLWREKTFCF
jgi:hypothetical protein